MTRFFHPSWTPSICLLAKASLLALILGACSSPPGTTPGQVQERDPWSSSRPNVGLFALTSGFLSDKSYTFALNDWGPLERDQNNGKRAAGDGGPIKLAGITYAKGLGGFAPMEARYNTQSTCQRFKVSVGIDDVADYQDVASAVFQVYGDGRKLFDSGLMRSNSATVTIDIDITGVNELRLVATDGGNGNFDDIVDWADARVECSTTGSTPYGGVAAQIPGRIQAENFDEGGQNLAYGDTTLGNRASSTNTYRPGTDVDLYKDPTNASNQIVGWPDNGEYLIYTTDIAAGSYTVNVRYSATGSGTFHLEIDNTNVTGSMQFASTGGYGTFGTATRTGVTLPGGRARLKLAFDDGNLGDVDDIEFVSAVSNPSQGTWTAAQTWPLVPIHANLLPDGKVLSWGGGDDTYLDRFQSPHNSNNADLWDPTTGTHTSVRNNFTELFCSGHAFDPDGRVIVAGGHWQDGWGKIDTNIFDYRTATWSKGADMNAGRWYPTLTPLGNGDLLVAGGTKEDLKSTDTLQQVIGKYNLIPQVWQSGSSIGDQSTSKWRALSLPDSTDQGKLIPYYSWLFTTPTGRVFNAGPNPYLTSIDTTGNGTIIDHGFNGTLGNIFREYGSAVMYQPGKVLVVGGGSSNDPSADPSNPVATAASIDVNTNSPVITSAGSMAYARRQHNATVLPDGTVLVTGGLNAPGKGENAAYDNNGNVVRPPLTPSQIIRPAELWNPATNTWRTLASLSVPRLYHSIALLMPDARVLVGGGGRCGTQCVNRNDVEIFTPPYLLTPSGSLAARPTISSAPATLRFGLTGTLQTPNASAIQRVTLVRLGSVTHSNNMNQRFIELSFTRGAGSLTVTAPANGNLAPPGHYMLFVLDGNGVPSVAKIVRLTP